MKNKLFITILLICSIFNQKVMAKSVSDKVQAQKNRVEQVKALQEHPVKMKELLNKLITLQEQNNKLLGLILLEMQKEK